jgi:hypothetical protein
MGKGERGKERDKEREREKTDQYIEVFLNGLERR